MLRHDECILAKVFSTIKRWRWTERKKIYNKRVSILQIATEPTLQFKE
jgi:hypothetical protein